MYVLVSDFARVLSGIPVWCGADRAEAERITREQYASLHDYPPPAPGWELSVSPGPMWERADAVPVLVSESPTRGYLVLWFLPREPAQQRDYGPIPPRIGPDSRIRPKTP